MQRKIVTLEWFYEFTSDLKSMTSSYEISENNFCYLVLSGVPRIFNHNITRTAPLLIAKLCIK